MSYEMKDGDLSLFKNDKKQAGSNQPDMRGKAMIDGKVFKISAWAKGTGESKFLSGKIEVDTYVKSDPGAYQPAPAQPNPAQNEQIPGVAEPTQPAPIETGDDLPFIWLLLVGLTGLGTLSQILPTIQLPI